MTETKKLYKVESQGVTFIKCNPFHSTVVSHRRAHTVWALHSHHTLLHEDDNTTGMCTPQPRAMNSEWPSWRRPRKGADGHELIKEKPTFMFSWCQTITRILWSIRMPCDSSTICILKYLLFTFARRYNLFFFIHVIFVTFDMAAATFQSRRRFKHVPQWLHTSFTIGWEVVKSRYKLMSFVTNVIWLLSHGLHRKFLFLFALSFISI